MTNLYIFAGLPGTGKSTLAQQLARRFKAVHLRIDTIEQGLRDLCDLRVEGEGVLNGLSNCRGQLTIGHRSDRGFLQSKLPTWSAVQGRQCDPWQQPRIVIDTAGCSAAECFAELIQTLHTDSTQ